MFNQYSYKTKFKFLIVFFIILSIAAYKRSFSNLLSLYSENRDLKAKNELIKTQRPDSDILKKQLLNLDKLIGKEGIEKEKIQQEIVNFLVKYSPEVLIYDLKPIHSFNEEGIDYQIYTFQLDLTGSYNQLAQLAYAFEKEFEYSKIISLKFYIDKKNNKTEVLHLKLIFQNYESKK
jgi:hypothetical protein